MKKDTISTGAFWVGAFVAFVSLRRINKYVRPVNHNPIADLAILGVEAVVSVIIGGACSLAADKVIDRYKELKKEKKEEKEKEENLFDEFDEGEPTDPEDGIHFTVINTEEKVEEAPVDTNEESDIFNTGWSSWDTTIEELNDKYKKGSEADGDV